MLWEPYMNDWNGSMSTGRIFSTLNLAKYMSEHGTNDIVGMEVSIKTKSGIEGVICSDISSTTVGRQPQITISGTDGSGVHQDIRVDNEAKILVFSDTYIDTAQDTDTN